MNPIDQAIREGLLETGIYLRSAPQAVHTPHEFFRSDRTDSSWYYFHRLYGGNTVCLILAFTEKHRELKKRTLRKFMGAVLMQEQQKKMTE